VRPFGTFLAANTPFLEEAVMYTDYDAEASF
jgi:hypothetical protein